MIAVLGGVLLASAAVVLAPLPRVEGGNLNYNSPAATSVTFTSPFSLAPTLALQFIAVDVAVPSVSFSLTGVSVTTTGLQVTLVSTMFTFTLSLRYLAFYRSDFQYSIYSIPDFNSYAASNTFISINVPVLSGATTMTSLREINLQVAAYPFVWRWQYTTQTPSSVRVEFTYVSTNPILLVSFGVLRIKETQLHQSGGYMSIDTVMAVNTHNSLNTAPIGSGVLTGTTFVSQLFINLQKVTASAGSTRFSPRVMPGSSIRVGSSSAGFFAGLVQCTYLLFNQVCPTGVSFRSAISDCIDCAAYHMAGCIDCSVLACLDCDTNYFNSAVLPAVTCSPCHYSCGTCTDATSDCSSCDPASFRSQTLPSLQCLCNSGYYQSMALLVCPPCNANCLTCSLVSTSCTSCPTPLWLNAQTQVCEATCPLGQYQNAALVGMCLFCPSNCKLCDASKCLTCFQPFWCDLDTDSCQTTCPMGQFQSPVKGVCSRCIVSCSICTTTQCTVCAPGYMKDSKQNCYRCNCDDCGTCPNNCPAKTFFFQNNCYGECIPGTFQNGTNTCEVCSSPCQTCFNATFCKTCASPLLIFGENKCVEKCPEYHYPLDGMCLSCFQLGRYQLQISQCKGMIPKFSSRPICHNPFSARFEVEFKASKPILSGSGNVTVQATLNGQPVSCVTISTRYKQNSVTVVLNSKGCQFSGLVVAVSLVNLISAENVPFHQFNQSFDWFLNVRGYNSVLAKFQALNEALPVLSHSRFLPLLLLLVPDWVTAASLVLVSKAKPPQTDAVESAFASQLYRVGCLHQQQPEPNQLQARFRNVADNQLQFPEGRHHNSAIFIFNSYLAICYVALSWLVVAAAKYLFTSKPALMELALALRFRVHAVFTLPLATGLAVSLRHIDFSDRLHIGSFVASLAVAIYFLGYIAKEADTIYSLNSNQEDRYLAIKKYSALFKKINWVKENNAAEGLLCLTDPVYYRVTSLILQLAFYLGMALAVGSFIAQMALLLAFSAAMLTRTLKPPFVPRLLSWLESAKYLSLIVYASFTTAAGIFFDLNIGVSMGRLLIDRPHYQLWQNLGWGSLASYCLFLVLSGTQEVLQWVLIDEQEDLVVSSGEADKLADANLRDDLNDLDRTARTLVESGLYEVQKITAIEEGEHFVLKIVSVPQVGSSPEKRFIHQQRGVFFRTMNTVMKVNHEQQEVYLSLKQMLEGQSERRLVIRTVGLFQFRADSKGAVEALCYTNVVEVGGVKRMLKGQNRLAWTPLQPRGT